MAEMSSQERQNTEQFYGEVVRKAQSDPSFKQRLMSSPAATLRAEGLKVPENTKVRIVAAEGDEAVLVLPPAEAAQGEVGGYMFSAFHFQGTSEFNQVLRAQVPFLFANANIFKSMCW